MANKVVCDILFCYHLLLRVQQPNFWYFNIYLFIIHHYTAAVIEEKNKKYIQTIQSRE